MHLIMAQWQQVVRYVVMMCHDVVGGGGGWWWCVGSLVLHIHVLLAGRASSFGWTRCRSFGGNLVWYRFYVEYCRKLFFCISLCILAILTLYFSPWLISIQNKTINTPLYWHHNRRRSSSTTIPRPQPLPFPINVFLQGK
jgi:hypothetical protein